MITGAFCPPLFLLIDNFTVYCFSLFRTVGLDTGAVVAGLCVGTGGGLEGSLVGRTVGLLDAGATVGFTVRGEAVDEIRLEATGNRVGTMILLEALSSWSFLRRFVDSALSLAPRNFPAGIPFASSVASLSLPRPCK